MTKTIKHTQRESDPCADAAWRKATASQANDGCVEVAVITAGLVAVRDSKNRSAPPLIFTAADWTSFLVSARSGTFSVQS